MNLIERIENLVEGSKDLMEMAGAGDCFVVAGELMMHGKLDIPFKDITLVHGLVVGTGRRVKGLKYVHAWIEDSRGNVYDYSNNKKLKISAQVYYALGNINPLETVRYSYGDASRVISAKKHWGPWDKMFKGYP